MKKIYTLSITFLIILSGCMGKKKHAATTTSNKTAKNHVANPPDLNTTIDIPTAEEGIKICFDEDINGFNLSDDEGTKNISNEPMTLESIKTAVTPLDTIEKVEEFTWTEEIDEKETEFKTVYFDFDKYTIREDQEENLSYNIELARKIIEESIETGKQTPLIVIDGHACHSAGSRVYNLALSEKRAKVLSDRFVQAGIDQQFIKVVGRGAEIPAIVNGKTCEGDKSQQWPNRRDELHIIYS